MTHELELAEAPFWHLDEELGELELKERPDGPDLYTVRLKAHTATTPYHAKPELHPLEQMAPSTRSLATPTFWFPT